MTPSTTPQTVQALFDFVVEAAKGCSDAKRVLSTLFPEAFVDDSKIFIAFHGTTAPEDRRKEGKAYATLEYRHGGTYDKTGIYLPNSDSQGRQIHWSVVNDDSAVRGVKVLVAQLKV
jgi:hypothetical protein